MIIFKFFRERATISIRRTLVFSAMAGLSGALVLGILNAAAEHSEDGSASWRLLAMFVVAVTIYNVTHSAASSAAPPWRRKRSSMPIGCARWSSSGIAISTISSESGAPSSLR